MQLLGHFCADMRFDGIPTLDMFSAIISAGYRGSTPAGAELYPLPRQAPPFYIMLNSPKLLYVPLPIII